MVQLGLQQDRSLEVPTDFSLAGWFERGPSPGERGPAVIAGHVDSRSGPAVFYRLSELRPGDQILVDRADGTAAEFVVERTEQHPKADFPTDAVYGWVDHAGLRLITCGGSFDRDAEHYRDNLVVFRQPRRGNPGSRSHESCQHGPTLKDPTGRRSGPFMPQRSQMI